MHCLLYARVSTDKQAEKDLSIPAQLQFMRQYAQRQGWAVVGQYIDEGESARTADRPELKRLLQYCQRHRDAGVVLVHKIDRLARNLVDYATIKAVLKQRGIRLVSVAEPFQDGPAGQLMENVIASISEWYSANLGEEVRKGAAAKLQRGEWPARPPIGYRSVRDEDQRPHHVPDPEIAPLVRQAFELYATGQHSLGSVAEELAERGLKTRRGQPFSEEMMKRLLTRRFYIGRIVWTGKEFQGRHPPLIEPALFYRAQEVLQARHADTGEKGRLYFLLRGIVACRSCGQRLTAERHPRGSYYRCMPDARCPEPYIPVGTLDRQVEARYERLQASPEILAALRLELQAIVEERTARVEGERSKLKRELGAIEAKELKLVDELVSGAVSRELYAKASERQLSARRAGEAKLAKLEVDYGEAMEFFDKCLAIAGCLPSLHRALKPEQRKLLARAVFKRIEVQDGEIVGVTLNPPFSFFLKPPDGDGLKRGPPPFEDPPIGPANRDIFEQILAFTLSPEYDDMKRLIAAVLDVRERETRPVSAAA